MRLIKDSRGRESWTVTLIAPGFLALTLKFLASGLTFPLVGTVPVMGGGEYATAAGALLGIWLGREWQEKRNGPPGEKT